LTIRKERMEMLGIHVVERSAKCFEVATT
jgi:hypothetical protein